MKRLVSLGLGVYSAWLSAIPIKTNQLSVPNPPAWITERRMQKVVDAIQQALEWDIRRLPVYFYADESQFTDGLKLNFKAAGFFRRGDCSIHLGPAVNTANFDEVFGHELVHAIFFQKYKSAIPAWLEEGLANFLSRREKVDYGWLSKQPAVDITTLSHPNAETNGARFHYQTSTAAVEMISKKCSLPELLKLSVGRKLTTYLGTYCEIKDVNADFRAWLVSKAKLR